MRLQAWALKNYNNYNSFEYTSQWYAQEGETNTFYLQLSDKNKDGLCNKGLRYIPASGATLSVRFPSVDDDAEFSVSATQPDSEDGSIWKVDLSNSQVPRSGNVWFTLTEGGVTRRFVAESLLVVQGLEVGGC